MARVAQFDTEMLKQGFTVSEAMIYGYLRWVTYKTKGIGEVRPSIGLMVKTLCLSRYTVIKGIKTLESCGLINVDRGYKTRNEYYINDIRQFPACCDFDDSDRD